MRLGLSCVSFCLGFMMLLGCADEQSATNADTSARAQADVVTVADSVKYFGRD